MHLADASIRNDLSLMMFILRRDIIQVLRAEAQTQRAFSPVFVCVSLRPRQTEAAAAAESSLPALISHMSLIMQREKERERRAAGECVTLKQTLDCRSFEVTTLA